jgi:predicted nucleic-acid-binding protein
VVLAEVACVLTSRYRCGRDELAAVVRQLTEAEELVFESTERVVRALRAYQHGRAGFADCLIGSRAHDAGCSTVLTFDAALLDQVGFESP